MIVVRPKNQEETNFILSMFKKMNVEAKIAKEDDLEDILFGKILEKTKTSKRYVSKESLFTVLDK